MRSNAFGLVYRNPRYVVLSLVVAFTAFAAIVLYPNKELVTQLLVHGDATVIEKVMILFVLLGAIHTNFTFLTATYVVVLSILFGVYAAFITFFIRRRIKGAKQSGTAVGIAGVISGIIGVGCAACGSFFLTSFSLVGAGGFLAFLPLDGAEFGLIGIVLLVSAIAITAKKIQSPAVCSV